MVTAPPSKGSQLEGVPEGQDTRAPSRFPSISESIVLAASLLAHSSCCQRLSRSCLPQTADFIRHWHLTHLCGSEPSPRVLGACETPMSDSYNLFKINALGVTWKLLAGDRLSRSFGENWCKRMNLQEMKRLPCRGDKLSPAGRGQSGPTTIHRVNELSTAVVTCLAARHPLQWRKRLRLKGRVFHLR
jgi:hypothetical protein